MHLYETIVCKCSSLYPDKKIINNINIFKYYDTIRS